MSMNSNKSLLTPSRRQILGWGGALTVLPALTMAGRAFGETSIAGKKIGYSQSFSTIDYLVRQRQGVIDQAAKLGLALTITDGNDKPAKQVTDLEDLVSRKMDAIIISTFYAEALDSAAKQINEAGIPIIMLSSTLQGTANWNSRVASDTLTTARNAAELFVKKMGGKGNVVHIEGKTGSVINQERTRGWREVIDQHPDIKVVGHAIANYDRAVALKRMEDFLQANHQIDGVYCNNDDMAMGAIEAIKEADRMKEMFVIGFDGIAPQVLASIYNGELYGTYYNQPFGVAGVDIAAKILRGGTVAKDILVPCPLITKENVTDFYDPATNTVKPSPVSVPI